MDFSRLKPSLSSCGITGIRVLKGAQVKVCGLCSVEINNDILQILATHFSYNEKLNEEKAFTQTHIKYLMNTENMRKVKSYTRRVNCCFQIIRDIQNYFSILDSCYHRHGAT